MPTVSLPYWDSRLDQPLRDPTRSIIWSPQFLGTVKGRVTNGPFAFWQTPAGPLARNGGQEGEYFTYSTIRAVMTRSHLEEISEPHAPPPYDFEIRHGDVHQHVGGLMEPAETAGYDPVFFLHHCFVDYLWEVFRRSQKEKGVDPVKDYPSRFGTAPHGPDHRMGLGRLLQRHGLSDMFTSKLYTYEPSPTCSYRRPTCSSNYLTCEFRFGLPRCVTLEMLSTTPTRPVQTNIPQQWRHFTPQGQQSSIPRSPMQHQFRHAHNNFQQRRNFQQFRPNQFGGNQGQGPNQFGGNQGQGPNQFGGNQGQGPNQFRGNQGPGPNQFRGNQGPGPNQFRGNQGPGRFNRRTKRQAQVEGVQYEGHAIDGGRLTELGQNVLSQFGGNQLSEFIRNKTQTSHQSQVEQQVEAVAPDSDMFKVMKEGTSDLIVSPVTNICPSSSPQNVIQNLFQLNGISDSRVWVWIPVQVVYKRQPEQMKFDAYPIEAGSMKTDKDIYDPTQYNGLAGVFHYEFHHPRTCRDMDGIYTKIMVHSDGLNYHGTFREFAIVDARQPFATSVVFIAIKNPEKFYTESLLSAYDPCGNVCKPFCRQKNGGFRQCDGALRLTDETNYGKGGQRTEPKNYGSDYGEATKMVWSMDIGVPQKNPDKIFIQFVCN